MSISPRSWPRTGSEVGHLAGSTHAMGRPPGRPVSVSGRPGRGPFRCRHSRARPAALFVSPPSARYASSWKRSFGPRTQRAGASGVDQGFGILCRPRLDLLEAGRLIALAWLDAPMNADAPRPLRRRFPCPAVGPLALTTPLTDGIDCQPKNWYTSSTPPTRFLSLPQTLLKVMKAFAMQAAASAVGLAFFTCASPAAHAGIVSFTSKADFEAALDPGAYTEPQMFNMYPNYAGSGFSYTASATSGSYDNSGDLSTGQLEGNPGSIVFNFGSGINAFGGYFYNTSVDESIYSSPLAFDLNNGAFVTTLTSPSSTTFYGFISDTNFITAKISSDRYPVAGTVIVGYATTAVPGPLPLLGAGAAFGLSRRLRRRQAAGRSDS